MANKQSTEASFMNDECDYSSENDCDYCPSHDPMHLNAWKEDHFEVLLQFYTKFLLQGTQLFGRAFMQFADHQDFMDFVHKHTVKL